MSTIDRDARHLLTPTPYKRIAIEATIASVLIGLYDASHGKSLLYTLVVWPTFYGCRWLYYWIEARHKS